MVTVSWVNILWFASQPRKTPKNSPPPEKYGDICLLYVYSGHLALHLEPLHSAAHSIITVPVYHSHVTQCGTQHYNCPSVPFTRYAVRHTAL